MGKKRHRRSPSNERSYKRHNSDDHEDHDSNLDSFSVFAKYKYELNKFLSTKEIHINDTSDFWKFLDKYQLMSERSKNTQSNQSCNNCFYKKYILRGVKKLLTNYSSSIAVVICNVSSLKILEPIGSKTNLIHFSFKKNIQRLYEILPVLDKNGHKTKFSFKHFQTFIDIILIYLDFKQKEKFGKLMKLRKSQNQLPVSEYREEITSAVHENRVVLIAGDTGCGKSTQIPQYILKAGFKKIACTQPRRIACISLAKRVAHEMLTEYNSKVAYQIRFEKTKRKDTNIIFITEGLLLRQASDEETLTSYDVVILDEVHERHLHGDFLIGIMKCLLYKRPDLKLILMSATININLFSEYFSDEKIKVIQVPGRLYPIDIIYKPVVKDRFDKRTSKFDPTPYLQIVQIIDEKYPRNERGDLLIFLSGIADITALSDAVVEYSKENQNWIVLQLHSSLSLAEQDKVFYYPPEGVRKCIISTNIAETSVTIDGVRFVIDSGKVNKMSYNMLGGVNTLSEQYISQDSAKQRSGRAGRTGPGVSYRLYSEEEFNQFEPFTIAEIHLVPLENLVLNMVSLGLSDITNFPFLEKPNSVAVNDAIEKLRFYGALYSLDGLQLTPLGEALNKLPVDLTIGKMLIMSTVFGNVTAVLCLAATVSVQSPYTNKAYRDMECQNLRKEFESDHGDPMTLLNLFKEWLDIKQNSRAFSGEHRKTENSRQWCKKRGLEEQRFYEIIKLMTQFKDILQDSNLLNSKPTAEMTSAERSIRYGELKKLRKLRYDLRNEKSSQKKKLKYSSYNDDEEEETSSKNDIRDVEFRISNDYDALQKLLNETSLSSNKDLTLLKLILCGGLYPQIAVGDEYNYCKSPSEQLFHTRNKNFVSLHPMSYFGNNTDSLKLSDDEIEVPPLGYFCKIPLSNKHKILVYQSLLETTKVYLMNTMRMPALQTLLLFSKNIQTNETLTRIACDEFLLLDLPYVGQGKSLLLKAIKLRNKWSTLLNAKLEDKEIKDSEAVSYDLIQDLVQFINTDASYTMKRLLKADLKTIYTFSADDTLISELNHNPFDSNFKTEQDYQYGGIKVTNNITYMCIVEDNWSINLTQELEGTPLCCPKCDNQINGSFIQKLSHEELCTAKPKTNELNTVNTPQTSKTSGQEYNCSVCKQTLYLTPIEQLRHKKKCI